MQGTFARSFADAPEIDGQHLKAGDMLEVVITDSNTQDLWGDLVWPALSLPMTDR